ncbi:hypothetical protein [Zavarzinella formosa]|uniref:hypothetical protein n=1 Tax=Zavarzinella formosa TaxID=360055 RepID=UPI0002E6CE7F|nr:hypothetical protein [Zavarzinella formosa]
MITKRDGNVIHADFGLTARRDEPLIAFAYELLYLDDHVALGRLTTQIGDRTIRAHHVSEADE